MATETEAEIHGWWGISTFFRCPVEDDPAAMDIALVGVPHSSGNGTTERDQHMGPRALRDASMGYRRIHREFGIEPWALCRVREAGDTPLPNAINNDVTMAAIEAWYRRFDGAGARPVSVGGDHSITLPILRVIAGPKSRLAGEPVAVVHFDAHHDSYGADDLPNTHVPGNYEWAGAWARIMHAEGLVDGAKVVRIGMREHIFSRDDDRFSRAAGYRIIDKAEFDEIGVAAVVAEIRQRIGDTPTYITFDLDVLDTAVAPGVANLEPGYKGMEMPEAMAVLHGMRGMNVIGGDVVCLMPTKDSPNCITAINGAVIMFEQISLIADYLARAGN